MSSSASRSRIYYIDSGRALASILGIFYHSALVFSVPWIVSISETQYSQLIFICQSFLSIFRMPLFLFVAGYFSLHALRKYDIRGFLRHRTLRILLPFVVSLIVLIPSQTYFKLLFRYGTEWKNHYWIYMNPLNAEFDMEHLWFLYYLAIYALLVGGLKWLLEYYQTPVIFTKFISFMHQRISTTLIFWGAFNVAISLIVTPLQSRLGINSIWCPLSGLAYNLPMFLFGCYCFLNKEDMNKLIHPLPHRIIGTAILIAILYPLRIYLGSIEFAHSWTTFLVIDVILRWILTLGVLSLLKLFLNSGNATLSYLSGASYPVYLFHQPIIVAIAYIYVAMSISLPVVFGYMVVCITSLLLTYFFYEIIIRRNKIGTFLFTGIWNKT